MKYLVLLFLFLAFNAIAQQNEVFHIDTLPKEGILLDKGWKWQAGDNPEWAKPEFADNNWENINPTLDIPYFPQVQQAEVAWFRLHLKVSPTISKQSLAVLIGQVGASEIYLNGRLIYRFGVISSDYEHERTHYLANQPFSLKLDEQAEQVLAIRYSFNRKNFYTSYLLTNPILHLVIKPNNDAFDELIVGERIKFGSLLFIVGLNLVLGLMYLVLYGSFRTEKAYLLIGISMILQSIQYTLFLNHLNSTSIVASLMLTSHVLAVLGALALLSGGYVLFKQPKGWLWWLLIGYAILTIPALLWSYRWGTVFAFCLYLLTNTDGIRLILHGIRQHRPGSWVLLIGNILFYVFFVSDTLFVAFGQFIEAYYANIISVFIIPIMYAIFLAIEFARTSHSLQMSVIEVKELSKKNLTQEQEKQQILANQNEILERQVNERTIELKESLETLKATQTQLIQSEKLASLGELTAGIAHEIQNPLNFVNNFSELSIELIKEIQEEKQKPKDKQDSELESELLADLTQNQEKINLHGKRASSIVKGMLEHSRTSTGKKELTDINTLADEYLRLAYHGFRAKDKTDLTHQFNAELQTDFDKNLPKIELQPQELGRVLLNLINNAFYTVNQRSQKGEADYQPKVTLSTEQINNQIQISIKDNGIGIPESIKAKIFQPFFTTKPTGQGTGLGLSLAYDIITKGHGGTLEVESTEGKGTEFIINLPI